MPPFYVEPNSNGGGGGGGSGTSLSVATRALASALPGSDFPGGQHTIVWVDEVAANYLYVAGSVAAIEGWSVLNATSGTGRLFLIGERVSLGPSGGDDGAYLTSAISALAGIATIALRGQQFPCSTPIVFVSNTHMEWNPKTDLHSTMPNGSGQINSLLYAPAPTAGGNVAIFTNPVLESRVIRVADTTTFPAGTRIIVGSGNRFAQYTVVARSVGAGVGDLTIDRALLWQFIAGTDTVAPITGGLVRGVTIDGNGGKLSGTGDRAIEFTATEDCIIRQVEIDAATGFLGIIASFDVGGTRNTFEDVNIFGNNVAQGGLALESQEGSIRRHCFVVMATPLSGVAPGIVDIDCQASWSDSCESVINGVGIELNSGGAPGESSKRGGLINCHAYASASHGCQVLNSGRASLQACDFSGNGGNGLYLSNAGTEVRGNNLECNHNIGSGIQVTASTTFIADGVTVKSNSQYGIDCSGFLNCSHIVSDDNRVFAGLQFAGASVATVTNSRLGTTSVAGGGNVAVSVSSTGKVTLDGILYTAPEGASANRYCVFHQSASIIELSNSSCEAGYDNGYVSNVAGARLVRGTGVDLHLATTPWTIGGQANFGRVTQVAGVATFPWSLASTDDVTPTVNRVATSQGLVGAGGILVNCNPSVGWTITSIGLNGATTATDESTFDVWAP